MDNQWLQPASDTAAWHPDVRAAHAATSVRLRQAMKRHDELFKLMNDWRQSDPVEWEQVIQPDQLGWELRLRPRSSPPVEEASILFTEVLGHLRTALNIALQEIARRGHFPVKAHLIQYPLALDEREFQKQERRLKGLPMYLRNALRWRQPYFLSPLAPSEHPLALIATLDNDAKHRFNLQGSVTVEHLVDTLRPELEDGGSLPDPRRLTYDPKLKDEWPLISEDTSPYAVRQIVGSVDLVVDITFEDRHGNSLTATRFTELALKEVSDSIGFLLAPWDDRLQNPDSVFRPAPGASFRRAVS